MKLYIDNGSSEALSELMTSEVGLASILAALPFYKLLEAPSYRGGLVKLIRCRKWRSPSGFEAPLQVAVPRKILDAISERGNVLPF
jgi:hypothetical protein